MSAWIVSIKAETKRPECELGDIVAVYDFEPTATEKEIFECLEIKDFTAAEITAPWADLDPDLGYPKFKATMKDLTLADKNELKNGSKSKKQEALDKIKVKDPVEKEKKK